MMNDLSQQRRIADLTFAARNAQRVLKFVGEADKDTLVGMEARNHARITGDMVARSAQTADEQYMEMYHACIANSIKNPQNFARNKKLIEVSLAELLGS